MTQRTTAHFLDLHMDRSCTRNSFQVHTWRPASMTLPSSSILFRRSSSWDQLWAPVANVITSNACCVDTSPSKPSSAVAAATSSMKRPRRTGDSVPDTSIMITGARPRRNPTGLGSQGNWNVGIRTDGAQGSISGSRSPGGTKAGCKKRILSVLSPQRPAAHFLSQVSP